MIQDDYLMRKITRAVEAIARALLGKGQDAEEQALEELDVVLADLLGPHRSMFDQLDATTMARLLGSDELVRTVADTCDAEATLLTRRGETRRATLRRRQAENLRATLRE
ncbi:MAG: hypothetical protein KC416_13255 [Myxococcales bacterium]|nr:hypothetical protein [Myxococcales bacterium]